MLDLKFFFTIRINIYSCHLLKYEKTLFGNWIFLLFNVTNSLFPSVFDKCKKSKIILITLSI
jgi:hypothetical protein